jgi:hypothetical protein
MRLKANLLLDQENVGFFLRRGEATRDQIVPEVCINVRPLKAVDMCNAAHTRSETA